MFIKSSRCYKNSNLHERQIFISPWNNAMWCLSFLQRNFIGESDFLCLILRIDRKVVVQFRNPKSSLNLNMYKCERWKLYASNCVWVIVRLHFLLFLRLRYFYISFSTKPSNLGGFRIIVLISHWTLFNS